MAIVETYSFACIRHLVDLMGGGVTYSVIDFSIYSLSCAHSGYGSFCM